MTYVQEFERLADTSRFQFLVFATRILRNHADAEDAVQRALLRGWRALDGYASAGTLTAWLYTILFNECRVLIRDRRRAAGSSAAIRREYYWNVRDPDPEQICMRHELQQVLHHEISRLPRDFRNLLRADLAGEEYTRTVAAKSLRQRARKGLRERMLSRHSGIN